MKKLVLVITGIMMAAMLAACSPTNTATDATYHTHADGETHYDAHAEDQTPPAGYNAESIDGALEKQQEVRDAEPTVTVCVYSVNANQTGLEQNMDGVDGETLEAQPLLDKMIELGVLEEGITVLSFDNQDSVMSLDLSSLNQSDNELIVTAIGNTFIQNFDAEQLNLSVAGQQVSDLTFVKEYRNMN